MGLLLTNCQDEGFDNSKTTPNAIAENKEIPFESITFNENGKLKLKFPEAFSNALVANKDVRRLIKKIIFKKIRQRL